MNKTVFKISKMDCPSEESLIRVRLDGIESIRRLDFDIPDRELSVYHTGSPDQIEAALNELDLGSELKSTGPSARSAITKDSSQKKVLWTILLINLGFFILELGAGLVSKSMGLVADSLDMLADSVVYGLGLFAVGGTLVLKKRIARVSGYLQIFLAILGFVEVVRRFIGFDDLPDFEAMIIVSLFALLGNATCLYLLQRAKSDEAHMKASMIFTSNDVIVNIGVITAALLVNWLDSNKPDLVIGAIVFVLVFRGALRILKLDR